MDDEEELPSFEPLNVKCSDSDCETDRHCFLFDKRKMDEDERGACRTCGRKLVDWERIQRRDPRDVQTTFEELQRELIRHVFFHAEFDERARRLAKKYGIDRIKERVRSRLRSKVGKRPDGWDGRQTPKQGDVIHYAQHATATCCRKCIGYWHNIPSDRPLTEEELDYLEALVCAYIDYRAADITGE